VARKSSAVSRRWRRCVKSPDKFLKDLQKRNGLVEIYDQLAHEKVMEFLENNAKVETVPAVEANPS
jgi:uncharacterized protein YutE (UPF0331/DUF86 family)